jgi:hypothetical protein
MKLLRVLVLTHVGLIAVAARAADATSPVDATRRNETFSPTATAVPTAQTPQANRPVQDRRIEAPLLDKASAAVGERRAAVEATEATEKQVQEKQSRRPDVVETHASAFNRRVAAVSTEADAKNFPRVAKYQDSLTAASATDMARFPAGGAATVVTVNRFVFRKNAPEPQPVTSGAPVVPAGGGSVPQK